jgi:catalase
VHDASESKPGLDSLAPADGSHRPSPHLSAPGEQPTAPGSLKAPNTANEKLTALEAFRKGSENFPLTTNQGVRIADDQNSLRAGTRGPTLLEDFILREKITHFDHERIPERIVHARGSAAHGYFQPYESLSAITKADFLSDPEKITPVFVRFSTVQGEQAPPIPCVIFVDLPPSFTPKRGSSIWWATTRPSFLFRTRINSRILFMR